MNDLGARCDRHVGEVFPPRCDECTAANSDLEDERLRERRERAVQRNLALGITPDHRKPSTIRRIPFRSRR